MMGVQKRLFNKRGYQFDTGHQEHLLDFSLNHLISQITTCLLLVTLLGLVEFSKYMVSLCLKWGYYSSDASLPIRGWKMFYQVELKQGIWLAAFNETGLATYSNRQLLRVDCENYFLKKKFCHIQIHPMQLV